MAGQRPVLPAARDLELMPARCVADADTRFAKQSERPLVRFTRRLSVTHRVSHQHGAVSKLLERADLVAELGKGNEIIRENDDAHAGGSEGSKRSPYARPVGAV